jgi:hypothetical protein
MPFFRPINLPSHLIAQSLTAVGLGLYMSLFRKPAIIYNGYTMLAPLNPSPRTADTVSLLGVVTVGLEVTYLVSSYMPLKDNQFLAASVPVRLGLAALMGVVCVIHRKTMSQSGFWELATLAVLDASAAIELGLQFGRFDGMVVNAKKWL